MHAEKLDHSSLLRLAENGETCSVIVIPENASPILCFAAKELSTYLEQANGAAFPILSSPEPGKVNLMLGEKFAAKAGFSLNEIPSDGFIIRAQGNNIFIWVST